MKIKEKKCKGQNKAINFDGCGGLVLVRTYGLCSKCYDSWLKTTPEGKEQLYKHALKHVTNIRKIKTEQKTKNKELLKTRSDWQKDVQVKINKIIRLIDHGQKCIASGKHSAINDAGHYYGRLAHPTLAFHAHNIFQQSRHSNSYKGGDDKRYREGLIDTFGVEYLDWIESLPAHPLIKLNVNDLKDLNGRLNDYIKTVDKVLRSPNERVTERNRLNEYLGIYQKDLCSYLESI